ncbi:hypothetical protein D039_4981A, partial [Vibrio parahaemolyticus EKP-028]
MGIANRVT